MQHTYARFFQSTLLKNIRICRERVGEGEGVAYNSVRSGICLGGKLYKGGGMGLMDLLIRRPRMELRPQALLSTPSPSVTLYTRTHMLLCAVCFFTLISSS